MFSGLAFAGIIYTILLQRNELQLQREELRETRDELKRSADAQEKSEKAFNEPLKVMQLTALIDGYSKAANYYWDQERKSANGGRKTSFATKAEIRTKIMESLVEKPRGIYDENEKSE